MTFSQKKYRYNIHGIKEIDGWTLTEVEFNNEDDQCLRDHLSRYFDLATNDQGIRFLPTFPGRCTFLNNIPLNERYLKLKHIFSDARTIDYKEWKETETHKVINVSTIDYNMQHDFGRSYSTSYKIRVFFENKMFMVTVDIHPTISLLYLSMRNLLQTVGRTKEGSSLLFSQYLTTPPLQKMYHEIERDLPYLRRLVTPTTPQ